MERDIWQKIDDAYGGLMEFFALIGWTCLVGFLFYFMISTIIKDILS